MNDVIFKELETISQVNVALEGATTLPVDAQKIINIFYPTLGGVSNEADYENGGPGKISQLVQHGKEILVKVIEWLKEKAREFMAFIQDFRLGIEKTEEEVAQAEEEIQGAKAFKNDKITLSPTITGTLAVEGVLDKTFPSKLVRLKDVYDTLTNVRGDLSKIAETAVEYLDVGYVSLTEEKGSAEQDKRLSILFSAYGKVGQEIARHLKTVDNSRSMVGRRQFTQVNAGFIRVEKVLDMASLPLPGGYALTSTFVKFTPISMMGYSDNESSSFRVVGELIENLSPNLVKVESAGISFSGDALDRNGCLSTISTCKEIIATVKNDRNFESDKQIIDNAIKAVDKSSKSEKAARLAGAISQILKATVTLLETDRFKTQNYAMKVVRAAVRYAHASVDTTEQKEVPMDRRLPAA